MTRFTRWIVSGVSLAALAAVWGYVASIQGTRVPYDEYVLPVALTISMMAVAAIAQAWDVGFEPGRGRIVESGEVILGRLRSRLELRELDGILVGESDGVDIRIESVGGGEIDVRLDGCGPVDLAAQRRTLLAQEDHVIGDEEFDAAVRVSGDERLCRAGLDRKTRRLVLNALARVADLRLEDGTMRGRFRVGAGGDAEGIVRMMLSIAKRLSGTDPIEALAESSAADPHAAVRRRCLQALCSFHAASPQCRKALVSALADADPSVRLIAAARTGAAGFDALEAIARDRACAAELRVEAFKECMRVLPASRSRLLTTDLLGDPVELIADMARELARDAGAQRGGLAVAEAVPAAGAVSVPVEAGALELAEDGGVAVPRGRNTPA